MMGGMELYDVMRTTGAVRRFTDEPLPDDVLERILDNARFAPTGGNRQGIRVIAVRDEATRKELADLSLPGARRYLAQSALGFRMGKIALYRIVLQPYTGSYFTDRAGRPR